MRSIDLSDYTVMVEDPEKGPRPVSYKVRESIVNMLFNPALKLSGMELLATDTLARSIMANKDDALLVEEADYGKIRQAIEAYRGFTQNDVEFVRRVLHASEVKVQVAA